MAKRKAAKKAAKKSSRKTARGASRKTSRKRSRKAAKRELIDTGSDKRYVRRKAKGRFDESDDVGRANPSDRRRRAKRKSTRGQGDRGDR